MTDQFNRELYGEVNKQRNLSNFSIINNQSSFIETTPKHFHSTNYLSYVSKGRYSEICDENTYDCEHEDLIIDPAGKKHFSRFFSNFTNCYNISFNDTYLKEVPGKTKLFTHIKKAENPHLIYNINNCPTLFDDLQLIPKNITYEKSNQHN